MKAAKKKKRTIDPANKPGPKLKNPLDKVIKFYPDFSDKEIAEKLKVKESYVRNVGGRYKLKKNMGGKTNFRWSAAEIRALHKYTDYSMSLLMEKLPGRTKWAIIGKKRDLNI